MSIVGLDHVQVAAPRDCESDARRFYGELLGLPELEKPSVLRGRGGVWFACGAQQLHVGVADDFVCAQKAHPAFRLPRPASALDDLAERLTGAGSDIVWDAAIAGTRRFFSCRSHGATASSWWPRAETPHPCSGSAGDPRLMPKDDRTDRRSNYTFAVAKLTSRQAAGSW